MKNEKLNKYLSEVNVVTRRCDTILFIDFCEIIALHLSNISKIKLEYAIDFEYVLDYNNKNVSLNFTVDSDDNEKGEIYKFLKDRYYVSIEEFYIDEDNYELIDKILIDLFGENTKYTLEIDEYDILYINIYSDLELEKIEGDYK